MSLVVLIYFDSFFHKMLEQFAEYGIDHVLVHFEDLDQFLKTNWKGVKTFIILGSTRRVLRDGIIPSIDRILKMQVPIIGICYGFQYMAMQSGGKLEDGTIRIKTTSLKGIVKLNGKEEEVNMWVNHFDKVLTLPTKKWKIDSVVNGQIMMAHTNKWVGFQFHPEYKKKQFEQFILPLIK